MKKYTNALVLWWSTLLIDPYSGVFLFLLFINPFFLFLKKWFEEGVRTNKRITMIRKFAGANNPFDTVTVGSVYIQSCDVPISAPVIKTRSSTPQ